MALSTNLVSNTLLKQYASQVKNNSTRTSASTSTTVDAKNTQNVDQEKAMQEMVFKMMLSEMMESTGNTQMSEMMLTALDNDSFSLDNSLNSVSDFKSIVRGASQSLSKDYSQETYSSQSADNKISSLGLRASKYESNLNPGEISNTPGDYGGKSYGAWQFSSNMGSLDSFINSLRGKDNELYSKLSEAKAKDGNSFGRNFDAAWTSSASSNSNKFLSEQQAYVKEKFYDPVAQNLKSKFGFDINTKSAALKESLWSTTVQHGVGGATSIFSKLNLNSSDGNIINDLYSERQKVNKYFRDSSSEVKQSVYNRFTREKQDMLSMLNG